MRTTILIFQFFIAFTICRAQSWKVKMNSINPVIKSDVNGDSIRKYFTSSFHRKDEEGLCIGTFYSNKLEVNSQRVEQSLSRIKDYLKSNAGGYEIVLNSNGGRYATPIFDTTGIILTANGINPQNAHEFQFRVLENKTKTLVPWTQPRLFTTAYIMTRLANPNKEDAVAAYLGQFKTDYNNALTFEIRRKAHPAKILVSISAYWLKWKPQVARIFTFAELPGFITTFNRQWGTRMLGNDFNKNWNEDANKVKLKKEFLHNENNLIFYLEDVVASKNVTQYNLVHGSDSTGWKPNGFDFNLVWLKDLSPGKYKLKIRYVTQPDQITAYDFVIHPAWYQTIWTKAGLILLILSTIGFFFLIWKSRKQSASLKIQNTLKQMVQTELRSIRSQFNPHFVFNAISSIQGLITRKDSDNASKYLLEFSTLMRDSLNASQNEFISIYTETRILENYLKLEKLRFGFNYEIRISPLIDGHAIEVPSLLLQPLIENAVKHGISPLQEKGLLKVIFEQIENDIDVYVTDNGEGFANDKEFRGYGLKLTRERIKLLNSTLHGQKITLSFVQLESGTKAIIHFKNWLL